MAWIRYSLYFLFLTLVLWALTWLEVTYPGSLQLQVFVNPADIRGTSEYSVLEMIQPLIIAVCGLLMGWVALLGFFFWALIWGMKYLYLGVIWLVSFI